MPFMPLEVSLLDSDFFALSTGDEFKAAVALWVKAFQQIPAGSLPDDDRILAHLSGAGARWKKLRPMALRGFVKCSDGRLYHPKVCEKASDSYDKRAQARENARKRGKADDGSAPAQPPLSGRSAAAQQEKEADAQPPLNGRSADVQQAKLSKEKVSKAEQNSYAAALLVIENAKAEALRLWGAEHGEALLGWQAATVAGWLSDGTEARIVGDALAGLLGRRHAKGKPPPRSLEYFAAAVAETKASTRNALPRAPARRHEVVNWDAIAGRGPR